MRWRFMLVIMALGLGAAWRGDSAWALQVGVNVDLHQDVNAPGLPDGFMIWGHVRSGLPVGAPGGGGWSSPPTLADHVDGYAPNVFTSFNVQISPDNTDPLQNRFTVSAQWSGVPMVNGIPYCTPWHLGLLFNVQCHNIIIDVKGTWLRNGLPVGLGLNRGFVPIAGFDVQDQLADQFLRLQNGNGNGALDIGEIEMTVVQMDVVSVPGREELETLLGPEPLHELYVEGLQGQLDWVSVMKNGLPISPSNPVAFDIDSFFDVYLGPPMATGIYPAHPVPIPPGGFLIARERVMFVNNNQMVDYRWVWELHEAHQADLGDAPDSTNTWGAQMTAYPPGVAGGVVAHYPTVYLAGSPPFGPIHFQPRALAWLGPNVTLEDEADVGPDQDGLNNLDPPGNLPDRDGADDGVLFPLILPHCLPSAFQYLVFMSGLSTQPLYVNVWFDWNRDGDWDDVLDCGAAPAPEWAVQNQPLVGLLPGMNLVTTPQFLPWHPVTGVNPPPIWMRITLAEQPWAPSSEIGSGGAGPAGGYRYGETEDYYFEPQVVGACCWGYDVIQCQVTNLEFCQIELQGTWMGPGTDCADLDGNGIADVCQGSVGACCWGELGTACRITSPEACAQLMNGVFKGFGTDCTDLNGNSVADVCEPTTGACCYGTTLIQCVVVDQLACQQLYGGVWAGFGTNCSDANGNGVADVCEGLLGACCWGEVAVQCALTTAEDCALRPGGVFKGYGTDCRDLNGNGAADICEPPRDIVVCEPQGVVNNPLHPPTYWYDVTPGGNFGRCDFHVRVYDADATHYTNVIAPPTWKFAVHQVGTEWWASWWDPDCSDAIYGTFRFQFDNPRPSAWGDWTTTVSSLSDPYAQVIDQSGNHTDKPDGYGYRVHVPRALHDVVVCEPQGAPGNAFHPPTYWYDVTPDTFGRCDFHVRVYDSNPANYTNVVSPPSWQFAVHRVGNQWWASWWDPDCSDAIFAKFRFRFDNPNLSVWSDWVTTIGNVSDPYASVIDRSQGHADEPDGYGYRVHVPGRPTIQSKWSQFPHGNQEGFDGPADLWLHAATTLPYKWTQPPDPELPGLHAHDWYQMDDPPVYRSVTLADDWLCRGLPVVRVSWYGNYETDPAGVEQRGSGIGLFHLSIHTCQPTVPWCVPLEPPLWLAQVPLAQVNETFTGLVNSEGCRIYEYTYALPQPFAQVAGTYYWLDVGALSNDAHNPALWRWQEARRGPAPPLGHAPAAQKSNTTPNWTSIVWSPTPGTPERYSDLAFEIMPPEFEVNKVIADDFVSDGRPITAIRWWGSYLDERYIPGYPQPDARHVVDGWLISFHHDPADTSSVPNCPPNGNLTSAPDVLGLYFAPHAAVTITGIDMVDCLGHTLYEYQVDLASCCLICALPDPRVPSIGGPAWPDRFAEVSGLTYWLDIQAVTGGEWLPEAECAFRYTGHVPSELTDGGHFWGWHTSPANLMPSALEPACTGRLVLPAQPGPITTWCPEYVSWTKQPWLCSSMPPFPPVNMAFELLTPELPGLQACCSRGGICHEVLPLDCVFVWQGHPQGPGSSCTPNHCPPCRGDGNCDLAINWRDIDYLVAGMNDNESAWRALFPPPGPLCPFLNLDCSGDGHVNWRDIDPFIALMNTTCPS
jgi:hypothetical protein